MGRKTITSAERERGKLLGEVISNARKEASMSQFVLAQKAGMDLDSLRGLEQGRHAHPSFFTVIQIFKTLNIPLDRFISVAAARSNIYKKR